MHNSKNIFTISKKILYSNQKKLLTSHVHTTAHGTKSALKSFIESNLIIVFVEKVFNTFLKFEI